MYNQEHTRCELLSKTTNQIEQYCTNYLYPDEILMFKDLSTSEQHRIALAKYMHELQLRESRILFHMTTTYKTSKDSPLTEKTLNKIFEHFYKRKLLPYILNTKHIHYACHKAKQPIVYAFIDEHECNAVKTSAIQQPSLYTPDAYDFPLRLHHHTILAVHPDTLERINTIVGLNTLAKNYFSPMIMTSDFKECDAVRLMYASKLYKDYPDYLIFPDTLKRQHFKQRKSNEKEQIR
jgi:hypothetical protein